MGNVHFQVLHILSQVVNYIVQEFKEGKDEFVHIVVFLVESGLFEINLGEETEAEYERSQQVQFRLQELLYRYVEAFAKEFPFEAVAYLRCLPKDVVRMVNFS